MQGQSKTNTLLKERCFYSVLHMVHTIGRAKLGNRPINHIDAYCGSGWNELIDYPGSPLIYHGIRQELALQNVNAVFIDKDSRKIARLKQYSEMQAPGYRLVAMDNRDVFANIDKYIIGDPDKAMGTMLIDPNNVSDFPFNGLIQLFDRYKKIDLIISYPATMLARCREARTNYQYRLSDVIERIHKKHWMIREPRGNHGWTVLFGSNFEFKSSHPRVGLYQIKPGSKGEQILYELNHTQAEKRVMAARQQADLFYGW